MKVILSLIAVVGLVLALTSASSAPQQYQIIVSHSQVNLAISVNEQLAKGWHLEGGVSQENQSSGSTSWAQAMSK